MPIHDWTRVPAGTWHFFHQRWIQDITAGLNEGGLPPGYFAMSEVNAGGPIPDVADAPPKVRVVSRGEDKLAYACRADRVSIARRACWSR